MSPEIFAYALAAARVLLALGLVGYCVYAFLTIWAARKWRLASRPLNPEWTPAVTILKPLCGMDAEMYANFLSCCEQDYPAHSIQIVFGALDADDMGLAVACRLQSEFPHLDIAVVAGYIPRLQGTNYKVCNLTAMMSEAKHDLLVLCDSDVRVTPEYLRRVTAPFEDSTVGLVTCPYYGAEPQSLPAVLEALGIGADFIPRTITARALEGVSFGLGQTIVLPRSVLEQLGGFESLAEELADDYRLGNRTRKLGYEVILSDYVVKNVIGKEKFRPMWTRRLRWARTFRALRPIGYMGSVITYGIPLAFLFLLSTGLSLLGWGIFGAICTFRLITALLMTKLSTNDPNILRFLPLLPLSDVCCFALFVISFCGNRVTWRGRQFRLLPGCRLAAVNPKSP